MADEADTGTENAAPGPGNHDGAESVLLPALQVWRGGLPWSCRGRSAGTGNTAIGRVGSVGQQSSDCTHCCGGFLTRRWCPRHAGWCGLVGWSVVL